MPRPNFIFSTLKVSLSIYFVLPKTTVIAYIICLHKILDTRWPIGLSENRSITVPAHGMFVCKNENNTFNSG